MTRAAELGSFEGHGDVGQCSKTGFVVYEPATGSYLVSGGGANMWSTNDAFHFVWKRLAGNFSLQADVGLVGAGGMAHRKACLVIRQALAPDAPYVDAALHGSGLASLQWRETAGGLTREIQSNMEAPARIGIERQGDVIFMTLAPMAGQPLKHSGAYTRVKLADPVYVGLGVCAHDDQALENARFAQVELVRKATPATGEPLLHCTLEVIPISARDRRAVYHTVEHIEAPNWSKDGRFFLFNSGGHIYRLPVAGGKPELIDTGFASRCNNDHGLSPDGAFLAISDQSRGGKSLIYVLPGNGGAPRQVTSLGPSYWHGWSPDGSTLAYCAERNGEFDIYTIPATGGEEKRLTTAKGLDDVPEYAPDGKFMYFNSNRTGTMQIWRMRPDGSQQEQVTSDGFNNWFPHPSPDGKWLVFLSYEKDVTGHPANKNVRLRLMPLAGGKIEELARFFGGQGTINVPSWSPDSQRVAYVCYELIR